MSIDTTTPRGVVRTPSPRTEGSSRPPGATDHRVSFGGFEFVGRVVRSPAPVTAPLLILGGSSQDRFSWQRHEVGLVPLCDVITVDLPGYGEADELPVRYGMDFLAAATRHLLGRLGIRRVNVLGGCFGGAIAMRFAQHYPDVVARLVFVGMTTFVPSQYDGDARRWLRMLDDGQHEAMATELVGRFLAPPGTGTIRRHTALSRLLYRQFMQQTPRQIRMSVATHNQRLINHEWYRPEPVPPRPALVFTGEHDSLTTPAMGRQVAAHLMGAAFTTIHDADHLVHMECIEEFTDLVGRFLTDRPIDGLPYTNAVEYPAYNLT